MQHALDGIVGRGVAKDILRTLLMPPRSRRPQSAAIMSVALLLSHVGEDDAAARVDEAVEQHLATRGDGKFSTTQVGDRILSSL